MAAAFRPGLHQLFPVAHSFTLTSDTLQLRRKSQPCCSHCPSIIQFDPALFDSSAAVFARPRPPKLLRIHAMPIDLDSPDWDPSPSALEELQSDPYTLPTVKFEQSDLPEIKSEPVKDEPDESTHHSSTGVQSAAVTITQASPPPPKTPPIPAPSPPKHSTAHRARTARSATGATHKPPPASPSPTTSSEDPVRLMTNVPILKNARPGQPPLRLFTPHDPPSTTVPPPALAPSLLHPQPATIHPPPLPTHRQTQVRIPKPHHNGHILPFHFSNNILRYLDSNMDRSTSTSATPPCPAPPPAFPTHGIPPPPQPAPPALFPPLPPLPELPLTDQQANQLTTAILRIARRAAAAAATNMLADNEP